MWTRWLRLLVAVVVAALANAVAVSAASAPTLHPVALPRDHGAHPAFPFEWWYTAGTVHAQGRDYFWFGTVWAGGGFLLAKVNVVDLRADRVLLSREYASQVTLSRGQTNIRVAGYKLGWQPTSAVGRWSIDAPVPGHGRLQLTLTPVQGYILEAPAGIIRLGQQAATAYYSAPRVAARGVLVLGGRRTRVTGRGWLDHQWGTFASKTDFFHWNWFACQFRDGSDLMLYQFITPGGQPLGVQAGTFVSSHGLVTHPHQFTVQPLQPFIRPHNAAESYPLRWRLIVPAAHVSVTLKARARHQFIANRYIPSFWEGAAAITSGTPGACIVESTRESAGTL
jgi:predicted secreted hydrolase